MLCVECEGESDAHITLDQCMIYGDDHFEVFGDFENGMDNDDDDDDDKFLGFEHQRVQQQPSRDPEAPAPLEKRYVAWWRLRSICFAT